MNSLCKLSATGISARDPAPLLNPFSRKDRRMLISARIDIWESLAAFEGANREIGVPRSGPSQTCLTESESGP
ncbi:MAG: hypothetical protein WC799_07325 [Desulfobacteraceae bacterium]